MASSTANKKRTGKVVKADTLHPKTIVELRRCIDPSIAVPFALRPRGGRTASTNCNSSPGGMVIDMSGLNRIVSIEPDALRVTVEAGVRLQDLMRELDEYGLELPGCFDLYRHTVGGAVAAPCFGAGIGDDAASLSRQIVSMKVVTPGGKLLKLSRDDVQHMPLFRASYGVLGVIAEVCFRVRRKQSFNISYRKLTHDQFLNSMSTLAGLPIGLKFYLLPYRDRVYLEIMRHTEMDDRVHGRAWKARDFGETVVMPSLFRSINRVVPIPGLRYRLIDGVTGLTQDLCQSRFLETGSYALSSGRRQTGEKSSTPNYSTWLFPASRAESICREYIAFCDDIYRQSGFRCDYPTVGFRVAQDKGALLSPSRREPMIALLTSSSQSAGWEDFVIDLSDFGERHGGVPIFSQTRSVRAEYAREVYGDALTAFIRIRRSLDMDDRLLNPFLAQYFR